ncbi:putative RNA-directed DNA polymerase [Helianthus annuus]|nr:putative RNA-directed DNA polymerase [Helianthus annuus]
MNLMSLNVNGVNGIHKPAWIRKLKRESNLSFLGLQETHKSDLAESFLHKFWDRAPMGYATVDAVGRSGGLASIWDSSLLNVDSVVKGDRFLVVSGNIKGVEERVNILNVHAPNDVAGRSTLWEVIKEIKAQLPGMWVILGDFNEVRHADERLNSRCAGLDFGPTPFKLFNSWVGTKDLNDIVQRNTVGWASTPKGDVALFKLMKSIKGDIKKWRDVKRLQDNQELDSLNKAVESLENKATAGSLNDLEKRNRVLLRVKIKKLGVAMAKDICQKARVKWIRDGDENTSFFHNVVNIKVARSRIHGMQINGAWVTDPRIIKEEFRLKFRKQFAEPLRRRPSFTNWGLPAIHQLEADQLISPFSIEEIKTAVMACDGNKAPGPDGFTLKFFKKYWDLLKPMLMAVMEDFYATGEISRGCNASFITLVPKKDDPQGFSDFRPISLLGSVYKILSKVLTTRLKKVMNQLIAPTQSAFVGGRNILDGPLIVSETVSWVKKKKGKLLIFKVDFEKAYDSINWKFLFKVLEGMNFPVKWISWVKGCLRSGRGSVLVNGSPSGEFAYKRGLRQGDPLSPFLFILAMQVLDVFMKRAVNVGLFHGFHSPNGGPIISHLCYADDVLFIGEWSKHNVVSLKHLLRCLYLVTGLKVNLNKCKLFGVGVGEDETRAMAEILNCGVGSFPFVYLGVPIGANMKRAVHWQPVIDKFIKKLSAWKAKTLSFAGRVTLAKSVLGSLPSYFLSLFNAPKVIVKKLESIRREFIWGRTNLGHKIKWVRWEKMAKPKKLGGIGVGAIRDFNLTMLSKWWWRYKDDPNQLWAKVIASFHSNANNDKLIPYKKSIPGVWKDIGAMDGVLAKEGICIREKLKVTVGDGASIIFWKDPWVSPDPLRILFPDLFRLAKHKDGTVASCWQGSMGNPIWAWEWRKGPNSPLEWDQLASLTRMLSDVAIKGGKDQWKWENDEGSRFSAKAVRSELAHCDQNQHGGPDFCWNAWAPLKVNYLVWRSLMGKIATKRGLLDRGINLPDAVCAICGIDEENADHLFAKCLTARSVWWNVLTWMKIPMPQNADSLQDIFVALDKCPGAKKWKKLVHLIALATVWRIWKVRNSRVFEGAGFSVRKIVEWVKEDAYVWAANRSRKAVPPWENWLNFDVMCLL